MVAEFIAEGGTPMSGLARVIDSGSSSIKYQLADPVARRCGGVRFGQQIGEADGRVRHDFNEQRLEQDGAPRRPDGRGATYDLE